MEGELGRRWEMEGKVGRKEMRWDGDDKRRVTRREGGRLAGKTGRRVRRREGEEKRGGGKGSERLDE